MKPKKFYKYHKKGEEKDLLEELLNRRRKLLAKINSKEPKKSKIRSSKKEIKIGLKKKTKRAVLGTIFNSIKYKKSYKECVVAIKYGLKNSSVIENEMGTEITLKNINQERERFGLLADADNLKKHVLEETEIKEKDLKNRQIWHAVFSLPNNKKKNKEPFKRAVREVAGELLHGHKYVFAVHENTESMHAHFVVKTKNDITGRQIRVNPKELEKIHEALNKKCLEYGVDLRYERTKNKGKKPKLTQAYSRLKDWKEMYQKDEFKEVSVNKEVHDKLSNLGMDKKNINSFLNMYKEDKKMAIWTVNKNAKIFNIANQENFTLRKVKLNKELEKENKEQPRKSTNKDENTR